MGLESGGEEAGSWEVVILGNSWRWDSAGPGGGALGELAPSSGQESTVQTPGSLHGEPASPGPEKPSPETTVSDGSGDTPARLPAAFKGL